MTDTEHIPSELPKTKVACFDGIHISISLDPYWPLLFAEVEGSRARFLLFGGRFVGQERLPTAQQQSLEDWLARRDTVWRRTAAYLAYDQWLYARNGKTVHSVPGPAELLPGDVPPTVFDGWNLYRIESGRVLAGYKLEVKFRNGEIRIVDVHRMCGDLPMFRCVFEHFEQATFTQFHVEWPDPEHDNSMEIEDQDLWGAGELSV